MFWDGHGIFLDGHGKMQLLYIRFVAESVVAGIFYVIPRFHTADSVKSGINTWSIPAPESDMSVVCFTASEETLQTVQHLVE